MKMYKMGSHDPFGHLKHVMTKRKVGVKLLPTTKSQKLPRFPYVQVACHIPLESSLWKIQLCFRPHLNKRSSHKIMSPQIPKSPNFANFGIPTLESQDKNDIWVLVPWPSIEYTIRGKVVASPKFGPWWVLWVHVCRQLVHAPKFSNYALTNLLFGLCKPAWVIELFVNLPSPIPKL
jgi:hypothetical protein